MLDIISLLDPDEVPECILDGLLQNSVGDAPATLTLDELQSARGELLSRSLIERNINVKKLWIHRVLQDTVRSRMSPLRKQEMGIITVALLAISWPKVPLDKKRKIDRWDLCQALYPHILNFEALGEIRTIPLNTTSELKVAILLKEAGW